MDAIGILEKFSKASPSTSDELDDVMAALLVEHSSKKDKWGCVAAALSHILTEPKSKQWCKKRARSDACKRKLEALSQRLHDQADSVNFVQNLLPGLMVEIHSLVVAAHFNGQQGVVKDYIAESQRWRVKLVTGEEKCVKPTNLKIHQAFLDGSRICTYQPKTISQLHMKIALSQKGRGHLRLSIFHYREALQLDPSRFEACRDGARCCIDCGFLAEADEFLAKGSASSTESSQQKELSKLKGEINVHRLNLARETVHQRMPGCETPFKLPQEEPSTMDELLSVIVTCLIATAPLECAALVGGPCSIYNTTLKLLLKRLSDPEQMMHLRPEEASEEASEDCMMILWLLFNKDTLSTSLPEESSRKYFDPWLPAEKTSLDCSWPMLVLRSLRWYVLDHARALSCMRAAVEKAPHVLIIQLQLARALTNNARSLELAGEMVAARRLFEEAADVYDIFNGSLGDPEEFVKKHSQAAAPVLFACWEQTHLCTVLCGLRGGCVGIPSEVERSSELTGLIYLFHLCESVEEFCVRNDPDGFVPPSELWIRQIKVLRQHGLIPSLDQVALSRATGGKLCTPKDLPGFYRTQKEWNSHTLRKEQHSFHSRHSGWQSEMLKHWNNAKESKLVQKEAELSTAATHLENKQTEFEQEVGKFNDFAESRLTDLRKKEDALCSERQSNESAIKKLNMSLKEREAEFQIREEALLFERDKALQALRDELDESRQTAEHLQAYSAQRLESVAMLEQSLAEQSHELTSKQRALEQRIKQQAQERKRLEAEQADLMERLRVPRHWNGSEQRNGLHLVPLSSSDVSVWRSLENTLRSDRDDFGVGRDYADRFGIPFSRLVLERAWRIEHRNLWYKYGAEVNKIKFDLNRYKLCAPQEQMHGVMKVAQSLPDDLCSECNEVILLHGTKPENVSGILHQGFNERFVGRGYFGFGTYLADDAGKADQYVTKDGGNPMHKGDRFRELHEILYRHQSKPRVVFYIFVCRASLGYAVHSYDGEWALDRSHRVFSVAKNPGAKPQKRELALIPNTSLPFHSLVIDTTSEEELAECKPGSRRVTRFREYIVTHGERIYPQYLLAVRRAE